MAPPTVERARLIAEVLAFVRAAQHLPGITRTALISCTPDILCWNITQSAGAYSTLTGVLAGFLVTAIIFSLQERNTKHISIPLYAASVACLSLALSSFLFALLIGADLTSPASTSLAYILGSAAFGTFALSVIQLMLSIIWFFSKHEINPSVIYGVKVLFQFMLVVGILYMFKFSVDVLRVKSGDVHEHPWIFLLLLGYALYAYVVTRLGVSFITKMAPKPGEINSGIANKLYNKIVRRLLKRLSFPGIRLAETTLFLTSPVDWGYEIWAFFRDHDGPPGDLSE